VSAPTDPTDPTSDPKVVPRDPRDLVLAALIGVLLTPFTGIVRALVFRLMWSWFLAPQYGEGPTLQTWFGIGVLHGMIFTLPRAQEKPDTLPKNVIRHVIENIITGLLLLGLMIVAAAMARIIWGWR
jgi:hypothetical protein